jgi:hypothetical protein
MNYRVLQWFLLHPLYHFLNLSEENSSIDEKLLIFS